MEAKQQQRASSAEGARTGLAKERGLDRRLWANLDRIERRIMVMSGKGGVGKSTVALYLALGLAARGYKTGLLDVDLHGPSIPRMLGIEAKAHVKESNQVISPVTVEHGLKVMSVELVMPDAESSVIWRGPLKAGVIKQFVGDVDWERLDYLIIDSPPGTGDELLAVAENMDDPKALMVTTPQEIALADVRKSIDFCRQMDLAVLGVVENMSGLVCPHCGGVVEPLGTDGGRKLAKQFGLNFLAGLPWNPRLAQAADQGKPLFTGDDPDAAPLEEMIQAVLGLTAEAGRPGKQGGES